MIFLLGCGSPPPPPPPRPPVEAPVAAPPADWTRLLDIAGAVTSHYAANSTRLKPPVARMSIVDPTTDKPRTVILRKQREVAMPIDADTAHWLVEAEDADTHEVVVLDYTLEWRPPPPDVGIPGFPYEVSAVEIEAVGGVERYTWTQQGDVWTRTP
jgi:hypothetical protein